MDEEKKPSKPDQDSGKNDPPIQPQKRQQSVIIYLIILFAAAFLLLLMAYFMQQRNNNAIIGNLKDSLTSFQTMEELREENLALQERLQDAQEEATGLQEEYEALIQQYVNASNEAEQAQTQVELSHALYSAEYLFQQEEFHQAAEQIAALQSQDLTLLSTVSENGVPSEAQRYETLATELTEAGYLIDQGGQLLVAEPEE